MKITILCSLAAATWLAAVPALAQTSSDPVSLANAPVETAVNALPPPGSSFKELLGNTANDFTRLASRDSARWLAIGTAAAFVTRTRDSQVGTMMARPQFRETFESGQTIGSAPFQLGGALTVYAIGRMSGNTRAVQVGGDLFRAQTVAQLTTYAMKYTIRRTRPDGTRFSFPSGHTSVTFASATVLQRNFGWKVGAPAYAVATFVAGSRLQTRRHHLSDVAFGAALGILAGRTVTVGRGASRFAVAPRAHPNGVGVSVTLVGPKS